MRLNAEEVIWFVQFDTEKYNPKLDTANQKRNFIYVTLVVGVILSHI